ncbi:hypothetical protein PN498_24685 [Oscillatoria sp. CS-180]|uniref:hypothetical protein n=1 Tax=Oscillatoria sp. CS-180 TaxID=3021720 RepID=UPI00232EF773|nr:hypothetical protein [Oscillatoria sp. CS-180]MDB9529212.1 hypothetical protein [Oscillatoria sp. CS-180]
MSSSQYPRPNRSQGSTPPPSRRRFGQGAIPPRRSNQRPRPSSERLRAFREPPADEVRAAQPGPPLTQSMAGTEPSQTTQHQTTQQKKFNRWMVWAVLTVASLGGIAGASAVSLLRIPNLPNCRAIFWPLASAATRLQCADAYADQGSVDDLLAAIALVEALPADHPLRTEINDRVEVWADEILHVADQTFNQGELEEAIAIAQKIPGNTSAAEKVSDRVDGWERIWEQAESIFREAEERLKASNFREAFTAAIKLRSVDNEYWATERYEALMSLISRTREEVNILASAERVAQRGTVDDILEALEQVAAIKPESYVHAQAQTVLKSISRKLLDLAEAALTRRDSTEATDIVEKIPKGIGLEAEVADFKTLIDAYELTWAGSTTGYESALIRLQSIGSDRPLYARAQELRRQWQWELEGFAQLNWAKQVARPGTVESLRAAITEAEEVAPNNPLWDETQGQIERWREDIAFIEDRPIIDRAKVTALVGDRASLQAAITEAQNVPSNSALRGEAEELVADWRWQLQQMDNQPLLTQARQLAEDGQLDQAISVASRIPPGQALHDEAQSAIADWESTQQEQEMYQTALVTAQSGSVDGLVSAIALAQSVPQSSSDWTLAQQAANQWSWNLLDVAESAAAQDVAEAISIASQIPPRTEAYAEAQLRIREWQDDQTVEFTNMESVGP